MRISQRQRNNKAVKTEWSISEKVGGLRTSVDQEFWAVHFLLVWSVRTTPRPSTFVLVRQFSFAYIVPSCDASAYTRTKLYGTYSVPWIHFKIYHDKTWLNLKLPWNYLFGRHQFTPGNFCRQLSFRNSDFYLNDLKSKNSKFWKRFCVRKTT